MSKVEHVDLQNDGPGPGSPWVKNVMRIGHELRKLDVGLHETGEIILRALNSLVAGFELAEIGKIARCGCRSCLSGT